MKSTIIEPEKEDGHEHKAVGQGECGEDVASRGDAGEVADPLVKHVTRGMSDECRKNGGLHVR
ncbi:MAG: hypothetical protein E5Y61_05220 [Mesorhizobium sp.]|nr:MAG: hypothetical protein E5Y61_05220 [Mesorhizobium sp.]